MKHSRQIYTQDKENNYEEKTYTHNISGNGNLILKNQRKWE